MRYNFAMKIPDEALNEFIEIYREEFEEDIDRAEASQMASRLLKLYELLSRKLPNENTSHPKPHDETDEDHPPIGFRV